MPRGPKHHLKRLNAPNHWMLAKLGGIFAPRPSQGPHKMRECIPLIILIRNRLKYALNGREVKNILMQRFIKVDGKVRTDACFPAGFMDVVQIEKTGENYRLNYTTKGKFFLQKITIEQSTTKLCKVTKTAIGPKAVPYLTTHDGRTIRYPHPSIKANDVVTVNLKTGKVDATLPFAVGNVVQCTAGRNLGRIGVLKKIEKHPGAHDIVHVEDSAGKVFATRLGNIFSIGASSGKELVDLPRGGGVKRSPLEELQRKLKVQQ